jgi:PAS domain S-box-containing protein
MLEAVDGSAGASPVLEAALAASEERYRRIVETAREGIWQVDIAGVTTYVNARFAAMLGWTAGELIGQPAKKLLHPAERASYEVAREIRRGEAGVQHEVRLVRKDGTDSIFLVESSPILDSAGTYRGILSMLTEITAWKQDQQKLAWQEARFRAFIEKSSEAVTMSGRDGKYQYLSPRAAEILGRDCIGVRFLETVHPDDVERMTRMRRELVETPGKSIRDVTGSSCRTVRSAPWTPPSATCSTIPPCRGWSPISAMSPNSSWRKKLCVRARRCFASRRRWSHWGGWRADWPMTSITC